MSLSIRVLCVCSVLVSVSAVVPGPSAVRWASAVSVRVPRAHRFLSGAACIRLDLSARIACTYMLSVAVAACVFLPACCHAIGEARPVSDTLRPVTHSLYAVGGCGRRQVSISLSIDPACLT
jgi:hypothetical protein